MTRPRIYLMQDVASSSLWTDEPFHGMVGFEGLGLREETQRALEAWSERGWAATGAEGAADTPDEGAGLREGYRLWRQVREELAETHEVGFALFHPHAWDEHDAVKRVVWDPDEAPSVEEVLAAWRDRPSRTEDADEALWQQVKLDLIEFCRQRAAERDRRTDPLAGAYEDFATRLEDELLVNPSQLALLAAAAVRWAARQPGYDAWQQRKTTEPDAMPKIEEMTAGELPGILDGLLDDLQPRYRRAVLDALRETLHGAGGAARERWQHLLDSDDE